MSYQASTWAAKQRTGSPSAKSVLLALANYAGHMGECFPSNSTLAEDTEQSRASVQRRMSELEAKGLIARFKRFKASGGETTMEIVLLFSDKARAYAYSRGWTPDIGVSAAPKMLHADGDEAYGVADCDTDDRADGHADCDPVGAANCDGRGRTAATGGVAMVQPPYEQSSEKSLEPPPTPHGGEGEGDAALALWKRFVVAWGFADPTDRLEPARKAFDRLTVSEAESAIAEAPRYHDACRARRRKPCHAKTWLADKGWEAFAGNAADKTPEGFIKLPSGAVIPANKIWIAGGTQEAAAWNSYTRKTRGVGLWMTEQTGPDGKRAFGCWKETKWPPSTSRQDPLPPPPAAPESEAKP